MVSEMSIGDPSFRVRRPVGGWLTAGIARVGRITTKLADELASVHRRHEHADSEQVELLGPGGRNSLLNVARLDQPRLDQLTA
jgi:hypothetical protein